MNTNEDVPSTSHDKILGDMTNVPTPFKTSLFWQTPAASKKPKRFKDKVPSVATSEQWRSYHKKKQEVKEAKEREKEERKRKRVEAKVEKEKERKKKLPRNKSKGKQLKRIEEETSSDSSFEVCVESEGEGDNWADKSDTDEDNFYYENNESENEQQKATKRANIKSKHEKGGDKILFMKGKHTTSEVTSQPQTCSDLSKREKSYVSEEDRNNNWGQQSNDSLETFEVKQKGLYKSGDFVIIKYNDSYYPGKIKEVRNTDSSIEYKISSMVKSGNLNWKWTDFEDVTWYEKDSVMKQIKSPTQKNDRGIFSIPEMKNYSSIFHKL